MATSQKMPKKSSLLTRFAKTAGKTVVGIALAYTGYIGAFYTGRGEPLTKGETQLVQSIFGDQLDASKLRKHFKDAGDFTHVMRSKRGTVMPFTNHIDFFGPTVRSDDFSTDSIKRFGIFLHEVVHTWQNQHLKVSFKNFRQYAYTLQQDSKFSDFGTEQQGDILEDYAMRWLHKDGEKFAKPENATRDTMLIKVVEDQFPQAKITRLQLQQTRNTQQKTLKV